MIELLREIRELLDGFSRLQLWGIHVDWFFHLVGAAGLVLVASRIWSVRRSLILTSVVLVLKELVDVFAKTRVEYIRPPTVDLLLDSLAGAAGIVLGYLWVRRRRRAAA